MGLTKLNHHVSPISKLVEFFTILINSFGSAITFPHFLHLTTSSGSYIGIETLTLDSEEGCSENLLY